MHPLVAALNGQGKRRSCPRSWCRSCCCRALITDIPVRMGPRREPELDRLPSLTDPGPMGRWPSSCGRIQAELPGSRGGQRLTRAGPFRSALYLSPAVCRGCAALRILGDARAQPLRAAPTPRAAARRCGSPVGGVDPPRRSAGADRLSWCSWLRSGAHRRAERGGANDLPPERIQELPTDCREGRAGYRCGRAVALRQRVGMDGCPRRRGDSILPRRGPYEYTSGRITLTCHGTECSNALSWRMSVRRRRWCWTCNAG